MNLVWTTLNFCTYTKNCTYVLLISRKTCCPTHFQESPKLHTLGVNAVVSHVFVLYPLCEHSSRIKKEKKGSCSFPCQTTLYLSSVHVDDWWQVAVVLVVLVVALKVAGGKPHTSLALDPQNQRRNCHFDAWLKVQRNRSKFKE